MVNEAHNGGDKGVFGEDGRPNIGRGIRILFELFWLAVGLIGGAIIIVTLIL